MGNKKTVWCNRLILKDGKTFIFDVFGNRYTHFNRFSSPSRTEVIVSSNQIITSKKSRKKRKFKLFGRKNGG